MIARIEKSYNQNNHIIISVDGINFVVTFQSYDKVMMVVSKYGVIFNEEMEDYTKTTCKYLFKAVDDMLHDMNFMGYISATNLDTLEYIFKNRKKGILAHQLKCTSYILNTLGTAIIRHKEFDK